MLKHCFTILLSVVILQTAAISQEYQPVKPGCISYFKGQNNNIRCIRIDSVQYQTDVILYPSHNIRQKDYNCYTPEGDSWIGNKNIIRNDGTNIFFNINHDSIFIRTKALLNESWTAYQITDSITVTATVTGHDTMNFLGLTDSVKTIEFQVYDKNMNPSNNILNNMTLKISKNYGFVKIFNFYSFPDIQYTSPTSEQFEEYNLAGLSNPQTGIQNLTWYDVNDFQPGDELHVYDEQSSYLNNLHIVKSIYKYLSRDDYQDSIVYQVALQESIFNSTPSTSYFNYIVDTVQSVIKPDSAFDKLPEEPVITPYNLEYYLMTDGENIYKTYFSWLYTNYSNDTCWDESIIDGYCFPDEYIKGLGGPYYHCEVWYPDDALRKLVYYKKGNITWGTPFILENIEENNYGNNINVFPNPADDCLNIESNGYNSDLILEISDIYGRLVLTETVNNSHNKVEISDLKAGVYIYRVQDRDKVIKTGKVMIK